MMAAIKVSNEEAALALVDAPTGPGSKRLPAYHHLRGTLLERLGIDSSEIESELD